MKYTRQRDSRGCGPTAIINTIKWIGYPVSYNKLYPHLLALCKTTKDEGTKVIDLKKALKELSKIYPLSYALISSREGIVLSKKKKKSLAYLSESGCCFIILVKWYNYKERVWKGHYVFVDKVSQDTMNCINFHKKETEELIDLDYLISCYMIKHIFVIKPK